MKKIFDNKTIMVTGGTGSFGKAFIKNLLNKNIKEIRIFSRDEKKQEDMRIAFSNEKLKFIIGDIRDYNSIFSATKGVDFIFHAAALKQVPSCEFYPLEAIKTNVLGAQNVIQSSIENNVIKVVLLSTDKAVYPINAMGMSKALMEKLMASESRFNDPQTTIVCATRYGNVMGSRGSVIPLFVDQIKKGKYITITDPEMTRFLMSLDESVNLVLYAFKNGNSGDIFVQKSPASTIQCLADSLTSIFHSSIETRIIGTRHSEKLYETLVSKEEMSKAEDLGNFYKIPADTRNLNYNKFFVEGNESISEFDSYNSHNTTRLNQENVEKILLKLDFIKEELNA